VTYKLDIARILLFIYKNDTLLKWTKLTSSACKTNKKIMKPTSFGKADWVNPHIDHI